MNKLFKALSLSLSANPRCLIKSTFSAATDVFANFLKNFSIEKSTRSHRSMVINGLFFNVIRGLRPTNLDCRITSGNDSKVVQCGRSMIEMLGVLAIIGVLSVGGIAGYSKAMTQFKVNKIVAETNQIIATAHEYASKDKSFSINPYYENKEMRELLGLCPESWKNCEDSGLGVIGMDTNRIFFQPEVPEMCLAAINNIAIPLKESVKTVYLSSQGPEYWDKCNDKLQKEMDKCSDKLDEMNKCIDMVTESFEKCLKGADGRYKLEIKNNYIGDDGNKYDESSKKGTLDFNDPRLISAVAAACRGKNSYVQITFKDGVIGI